MARVNATSTDVYARLARGECANYHGNTCQRRTPCLVTQGEACDYFNNYVKPLLDTPEFSAKYAREAKITVALNPKAKVIRKGQGALTIAQPEKPAAITVQEKPAAIKLEKKPERKPIATPAAPATTAKAPTVTPVEPPRPTAETPKKTSLQPAQPQLTMEFALVMPTGNPPRRKR